MTKARELLELFSDFDKDYDFIAKVAGHSIGHLTLDNGVGTVDIELPLDDIDPDSTQVILPIHFTYDESDFSSVSLKMEVGKYLAAADGNPADLSPKGKTRILDYLKSNKAKLERAFEGFIYNEVKKAREESGKDY